MKDFSPRQFLARSLRWAAHRINPSMAPELGAPMAPWQAPEMPSWVAQELKILAQVEPDLLRADDDVRIFSFYSVPSDGLPGIHYSRMLDKLQHKNYTHVFLVPWLKPGGADRGTLHFINGLLEAYKNARILVIGTEPAESEWRDRLPMGVDFIESGLIEPKIDFERQVASVTRLLVQLAPPVIHIINSRVGWEIAKRHGLALRQASTLFASVFCDDVNANGRRVGYARDYLADCQDEFSRILCDNSVFPVVWNRALGVPIESFMVVPFPYDSQLPVDPDCYKRADDTPPKVLWAGRLDRQKRPDLLIEIAKRMPDVHFDVHGKAVLDNGDDYLDIIRAQPNMTFHGPFEKLVDVADSFHVAFLMTTEWEGVPTILLDAAAASLPICAPNVGGIPDLLPRQQLVDDVEDIDDYVRRLRRFIDDVPMARETARAQLHVLKTKRSWPTFVDLLRRIDGYVETLTENATG